MNYMFYLRSKISSQPLNPSHDTSPYRFAFEFEVKFANLNVNFTHRDPHRKNAKFKPATLCVSKAMSPPLTCSGVGEGFCVAKLATVSRRERVCLQLRGKAEAKEKGALLRFARSCKQSVSRPALLRILLAAFGEAVTSRRRS